MQEAEVNATIYPLIIAACAYVQMQDLLHFKQ